MYFILHTSFNMKLFLKKLNYYVKLFMSTCKFGIHDKKNVIISKVHYFFIAHQQFLNMIITKFSCNMDS